MTQNLKAQRQGNSEHHSQLTGSLNSFRNPKFKKKKKRPKSFKKSTKPYNQTLSLQISVFPFISIESKHEIIDNNMNRKKKSREFPKKKESQMRKALIWLRRRTNDIVDREEVFT